MAKRPFFGKRRPQPQGLFLSGRRKPVSGVERIRLTLYLSPEHLDLAEILSNKAGARTIQTFCENLLESSLMAERSRSRIGEAEAKRGKLEGLREIADDPAYLAEWNASTTTPQTPPVYHPGPIVIDFEPSLPAPAPIFIPQRTAHLPVDFPKNPTSAARSILAHSGDDTDEARSFLGYLRQGENPPPSVVDDLVDALGTLDAELRSAQAIDRQLAYALHRIAFESQVLLTDAFPNAFNDSTVHTLRALQEAVDRILSGEDIRYLQG